MHLDVVVSKSSILERKHVQKMIQHIAVYTQIISHIIDHYDCH